MHRVCLTFDFDAVSPWIHVDDVDDTPDVEFARCAEVAADFREA